jgi:hypothetical protein
MVSTLEPGDRAGLRQFLVERFSMEELKALAFDLGVDHDALPHATTTEFSMALIEYFEHRGNLDCLLAEVKRRRPDDSKPLRLSESSPEHPRAGKVQAAKLDVLRALYRAYRTEPTEKVNSEQVRRDVGLSSEQMTDIIIVLKEQGFIEASFVGSKALLRITADGVILLKE